MKRDLQGRVSGQVTPGTEPEMPVLSFHCILSWHLGNVAKESAAIRGPGRDAAVSGTVHLAGHMQGHQKLLFLGHCLLMVLVF